MNIKTKRRKARELFEAGKTREEIAAILNIVEHWVDLLLPKKRQPPKPYYTKYTRLPMQEILAAIQEGLTEEELCKQYGITHYLVNRLLYDYNIDKKVWERQQKRRQKIRKCKQRQQKIRQAHDDEGMTFRQIGMKMSITRQRVQQLYEKNYES